MSRDEDVKNPRLFDTRTVERNIRKGLITRKDYEKFLKTIPDVAEKIAPAEEIAASVAAAGAEEDDYEREEPRNGIGAASASDEEGGDDDLDDDDLDDEDEADEDDGKKAPPAA